MTTPKTNLQNMQPEAVASKPAPSRVAIWGMPLAALVLAIAALLLVWFGNDRLGIADGAPRTRLLIGIPIALVVVVIAHLFAVSTGAYGGAARLFRSETGDRTKAAKSLKRDARLQRVYEELRVSHGWRWQRRLRWLLLNGTDERVDQVAPGLKQAGIMHVGETVLVHAAPDGIGKEKWLGQIRKLRRRPVDGVVHVARADDMDTELPRTLSGIASSLGWAAPVAFLHPVEAKGSPSERFDAVGAFMPDAARRQAREAASGLPELLAEIEHRSADAGVRLYTREKAVWLMDVSKYVSDHAARVGAVVGRLAASNWLRAPLAGVLFAPVFPGTTAVPVPVANDGDDAPAGVATTVPVVEVTREQPRALLPVWQQIAASVLNYRGRRTGLYWPDVLAWCVVIGAFVWIVLMVISGLGNRALVKDAETTATQALAATPGTPPALRAQLALQNEIATLEYRQQHGVPWYLRAGVSHNDDLLAALWRPYQTVATRNLQQPVVQALEGQLAQLSQVRADEQQSHDAQQQAYNRLKAYLMLATPSRTDAQFLKAQMLAVWPAVATMRTGEWLDTSQQLAGFWADRLKAHPGWRINASMPLVTQLRSTLVNQIGLAASDDVLYLRALDEARGKYADVSLATLLAGADAHGLFTTTQAVPGIFTRAAWEGFIEKAIDDAVKRQHVEGDWVLTGDQPTARISATAVEGAVDAAQAALDARKSADDLKKRLRDRYFTDYTAAWATMLNSFRWIGATSFSGVIDQLTRLTDAQTSPLLAVMKSVQYQGEAGRPSQALTDTLVRKAQGLLGDSDAVQAPVVNPLDRTFGPLLALMGDASAAPGNSKAGSGNIANAAAFSGVSLSRVLTADTTVRLKLQQIQASPDAQAMARSLAQAIFQGKLSDLSQARDDAALTAASLGAQWAGFGQTLFVQPLDAAWQAVLQPAAASLNDAWRSAVAAPFQSSFASRYPFASTSADASFAEFGRYVRPDTGLINRFIDIELTGVLKRQGDQWVPNELAPQSLQFDPKFLAMLRLIGPMGAHLYAQGEAGYHFNLMPQPTPTVTRTELTVDGQPVVYFNQHETWSPLAWPGNGLNGHASLNWQSLDAGTRIAFDATGDWAFLRMIEKAGVKPLDDTRYELVWNGGAGSDAAKASSAAPAATSTPNDSAEGKTAPLRYVLRTQAGAGPLDLLKLRGFQMPERIFITGRAGQISGLPSLPPLPPELQP
ncbi:ImcF-related family protein [Paraburkholderia caballeronis]|uniref:Type VI secretion system protein ImpL n=1 Tax=Paraburkholderia caballeronis TaxID=416943 RepID=A0A1H7RQ34_9BURK|nr:ImcF-related family protein [Paraburkholderia caballeronis]PXW23151.1 type VI secretion system protein ImpL [Paraburkholderia caballeronis]PXW97815.1 type VI secretion system protein ImpL [Paraburkholderia caballeronis]RAJ94785.1 type VI secretion system protein ImpL [Paraburkholderia caballeronis]SEE61964.1 type VI secretion system protein ImpL [Paraburkholderia caballeronis]SEL62303.1 type VI secretion system protein ImpL [Paraburkholderia caballeronis]